MALRIEDYAIIGDTQTAALVGRDGSIDWLCVPRFDSGACFAGLLGTSDHGHWLLHPRGKVAAQSRRYRYRTLVLETDFETAAGAVRVIDFMPPRSKQPHVVRIVEGIRGSVEMEMELVIRFDYGKAVPWVRRHGEALRSIAGPSGLVLRTPVETKGRGLSTVASFRVARGERIPFVLTWYQSEGPVPRAIRPEVALDETVRFWLDWVQSLRGIPGPWAAQVARSLITLKALTYQPTGGILAAATTSLPEELGGERNWDYRYCWVRDATLTLDVLIESGAVEEAKAWRRWLLRAAAGSPEQLQIMYGPAGERRLVEYEIDWLPGYGGSRPVRVGNAAAGQFQLDVYGELMDALERARHHGITEDDWSWPLQRAILDFVEGHWADPDNGIWEVRGPLRHFVHSRVMAWVAFDRAIRGVEHYGLPGPVERWRQIRQTIHDEVCRRGFNRKKGAFTQYYGSDNLDASVLMIAVVGFLPPTDERVVSTIEAIERELVSGGFVRRYDNHGTVDGLAGREGVFLACSFWLVDNLAMIGRYDDARALYERLVGLCNDVGLLSEEYDPAAGRMLGNFPQAFSHVGLVNSARTLSRRRRPRPGRHPSH